MVSPDISSSSDTIETGWVTVVLVARFSVVVFFPVLGIHTRCGETFVYSDLLSSEVGIWKSSR